jgi:hypothetical protein
VTGPNPRALLAEEPQGSGQRAPRPAFGLREVLIVTIVILGLAALLVFILYGSPVPAS